MDEVIAHAVADLKAYTEGGVTTFIVENYGDAPFSRGKVDGVTVSAMTLAAVRLKTEFPAAKMGINVLRNDASAAMSIATVVGAEFIRVNVHVGAVLADQGIVEGNAYHTLRLRKNLNSNVLIYADVDVKHSARLGDYSIMAQAADAIERGLADAIIVSGSRTGEPVDMRQLKELRTAFPKGQIIVGSGANSKNVKSLLRYADGVIVGTALKSRGIISAAVDPGRVRDFVKAAGH